jgi:hypothetical protein
LQRGHTAHAAGEQQRLNAMAAQRGKRAMGAVCVGERKKGREVHDVPGVPVFEISV